MEVRQLDAEDVRLMAEIDRSEHVEVEYTVVEGCLEERPVTIADIPPWDPVGTGPHTVAEKIEFCRSTLAGGGILLGAFDGDHVLGLAIVDPSFEPPLAWLASLHVSRPHRRAGAASALWQRAVELSVAAGATSLYVSATPTGSAVGFYLSRGCVLADPVHPDLYADEPEDIHLVCSIDR